MADEPDEKCEKCGKPRATDGQAASWRTRLVTWPSMVVVAFCTCLPGPLASHGLAGYHTAAAGAQLLALPGRGAPNPDDMPGQSLVPSGGGASASQGGTATVTHTGATPLDWWPGKRG